MSRISAPTPSTLHSITTLVCSCSRASCSGRILRRHTVVRTRPSTHISATPKSTPHQKTHNIPCPSLS
ncbi:hypothetical protein B0J17DRAFT_638038 [Rhizoctonia solani]|nr:hypothetical protein B0J17DRAFT_638038 [Rhizoctonia solani]